MSKFTEMKKEHDKEVKGHNKNDHAAKQSNKKAAAPKADETKTAPAAQK